MITIFHNYESIIGEYDYSPSIAIHTDIIALNIEGSNFYYFFFDKGGFLKKREIERCLALPATFMQCQEISSLAKAVG